MSVYEKLINVQRELKAPKGQYNSFGKYNYRSCEDILEAVKPILSKHKATIIVGDNVEMIGERIYIKAIARFVDVETGEAVENTAYAREEETKKGMDGSQITGTASSYARKYCLNGLLLIDDTKDADTDEFKKVQEDKPTAKAAANQAVKFDHAGKCFVLVATKEGNKHSDITTLSRQFLEKIVGMEQYEQAKNAINAELNVRSLRGE